MLKVLIIPFRLHLMTYLGKFKILVLFDQQFVNFRFFFVTKL